MRRRAFIASCAAGAVAATATTVRSQTAPNDISARAIGALVAAKRLQVAEGLEQRAGQVQQTYHSDAMLVEPAALAPSLGRGEITSRIVGGSKQRKLLYFYYRQPQVVSFGNVAVVISNYESGHSVDGQTFEDSGKTSNVVLLGSDPPLIALEVVIPNLRAGSYGALGTALAAPRFGMYPLRALGSSAAQVAPQTAGGGENDVLYDYVQRINKAWLSGDTAALLGFSNTSGVFLIGDYSPYYITGTEDITQHFIDFYKTSRVHLIRSLDPVVRIWGSVAAVAFNFDLDYMMDGKTRRSPGRGVYTFVRRGFQGEPRGASTAAPAAGAIAVPNAGTWSMVACAASHLVTADIGDAYPSAA